MQQPRLRLEKEMRHQSSSGDHNSGQSIAERGSDSYGCRQCTLRKVETTCAVGQIRQTASETMPKTQAPIPSKS